MKESFEKVNDYTLAVRLTMDTMAAGYSEGKFELTRIFNFEAAQVTTIARDWLHQNRGTESGGSSATSLQMRVEDFADVPSQSEIGRMHRKLTELGGHPPPQEEVMSLLVKKRGLSAGGAS